MEQMRRTILRGLAAFRWLAWLWMAAVLVLARGSLVAPASAALLVGAAGLVTLWLTWQLATAPQRLVRGPAVGVEVGVGVALQLADGFVYATPHVFTVQQPLGVGWPIAGILAAGVALGPLVGALTGVMLGAARAVSSILHVVPPAEPWLGPLSPEQGLSLLTTTVLYALAGGIAGHATRLLARAEERLTRAERTVAALEAREDVARRLHDGVLQTLAIVERRAEDADLARLARDQERELRRYLLDPAVAEADDVGRPGGSVRTLGSALREVSDRAERRDRVHIDVLVPDDLPPLGQEMVEALADAVGEALNNVGKHAQANRVVVYAEPQEDTVFVSVRDDGVGFDPAQVTEGLGLTRSVRGRLAQVGGRVEVAAGRDRGVEVRLWAPVDAP